MKELFKIMVCNNLHYVHYPQLGTLMDNNCKSTFSVELEETFQLRLPKVIFCQSEREQDVAEALRNIKMDARIVTYNKSENNTSFLEFIGKYGSGTTVEEFK